MSNTHAFAFVKKINGIDHFLLQHHTGEVDSPDDDNSVDLGLLKACLRIVECVPDILMTEDERNSVKEHLLSHAKRLEVNEKNAEKIINQQDFGKAPDESALKADPEEVPIVPGVDAAIEDTNDDPVVDKTISPDDPNKGGSPRINIEQNDIFPEKSEGSKHTDKEKKKRGNKKSSKRSGSKYSKNSIVLSGEELLLITSDDKALNLKSNKYVDTDEVSGEVILKDISFSSIEDLNKIKILNTKIDKSDSSESNMPEFAFSEYDKVSEDGRKYLLDILKKACDKKAIARISDVRKMGTIEFMQVEISAGDDMPSFLMMLDLARDSDGKITHVRMINEIIPSEFLKDVSKLLSDLSKEG